MHTIIVPTDFSETSKNAAFFAVQVAAQVKDSQVLLYNVFDKMIGSDSSPVPDEPEAHRKVIMAALENLKAEMLAVSNANIVCIAEEDSNFIDSLERLARYQKADLIVMGITGATRLEQIFMGSNALDMIEKNVCPIMIVPPEAQFKGVKNILFATDLKNVEKTTPVRPLQAVLNLFNPTLHIVNVDSDHFVELTEDYKKERAKLENMLKDYKKEFYFIRMFDFIDAVNQFSKDKSIDILIIIRKKGSFLSNLFKPSQTKKLAYHSTVPLVVVHE